MCVHLICLPPSTGLLMTKLAIYTFVPKQLSFKLGGWVVVAQFWQINANNITMTFE